MNMSLEAAIEEDQQGMREGDIPNASVLAHGGKVIGRSHNHHAPGYHARKYDSAFGRKDHEKAEG